MTFFRSDHLWSSFSIPLSRLRQFLHELQADDSDKFCTTLSQKLRALIYLLSCVHIQNFSITLVRDCSLVLNWSFFAQRFHSSFGLRLKPRQVDRCRFSSGDFIVASNYEFLLNTSDSLLPHENESYSSDSKFNRVRGIFKLM